MGPSLPGRAPKRPDTDLNPGELERRNKRRAHNREAAERQRQRRQHKVVQLEEEVPVWKTEKNELKEQNKKLQEEIERVRFQLKVLEGSQQRQIQQYQYHQQPMTTMASSLTPTFFMADATNPVTPVFVSTPVRPEMVDSTDGGEAMKISFEGLRHPLLEQGANEVVANDVALSGDKRLMILTGPNMGGKSTYLRSVAVAIILAQIGSFVPAEQASLSVFDAVITRIGAADNLARGVSTFLHEMSECESIFRQASTKSFVAIDELGRGTSTWDGFGLAWSIAEHIATKIKCLSIFATHYHEMASLETKNEHVFNMHTKVHVDAEKVTHLYQVEPGASSTSYGIEIAQLAGFP